MKNKKLEEKWWKEKKKEYYDCMVSPTQQKKMEHSLLLFSLSNCQTSEIYSSNIYYDYYSKKTYTYYYASVH